MACFVLLSVSHNHAKLEFLKFSYSKATSNETCPRFRRCSSPCRPGGERIAHPATPFDGENQDGSPECLIVAVLLFSSDISWLKQSSGSCPPAYPWIAWAAHCPVTFCLRRSLGTKISGVCLCPDPAGGRNKRHLRRAPAPPQETAASPLVGLNLRLRRGVT